MQAQMQMMQMMQDAGKNDFALQMIEQCWDVCYAKQLTRDDLVGGVVPEARMKQFTKCQNKCVARHFEVLNLMLKARQQREREAAMGLPPGPIEA
jgi:hypothetical protein